MLILLEDFPSIEALTNSIRTHWSCISKHIEPQRKQVLIEANSDVILTASKSRSLFLIDDGMVTTSRNNHSLFNLENGDLIGLEQFSSSWNLEAFSTFAIKVTVYPIDQVLKTISDHPPCALAWSSLLTCYAELLYMIAETCAQKLSYAENLNQPRVQHFEKGEVIIQQNALNDEVYTLVQGSAEALIDGVKVGEIREDEIFGAIAAIAGVPRTASVIASSRCMALSLSKSDFLRLLKERPATVMKLIQDMARALSGVNERVVNQTKISG